jgi:hypothetical protein
MESSFKQNLIEALKKRKRKKMKKSSRCWKGYKPTPGKEPYSPGSCMPEGKGTMPKMKMGVHKSRAGGLTQKGVEAYRRKNPGSKLKTAVTTKPSKLKKGSKSAKRRKSFCSRMGGMKKRLTSKKTASDPNSRINKALRKWNC